MNHISCQFFEHGSSASITVKCEKYESDNINSLGVTICHLRIIISTRNGQGELSRNERSCSWLENWTSPAL